MEYFEIELQKKQRYLHDKLDKLNRFTESFSFHRISEEEKKYLIKKRNNMKTK